MKTSAAFTKSNRLNPAGQSRNSNASSIPASTSERLALSRDKKRVRKLAREGHTVTEPADLLKEPFVLEFLGLDSKPAYSETDLESAIIDKLQKFLLEECSASRVDSSAVHSRV